MWCKNCVRGWAVQERDDWLNGIRPNEHRSRHLNEHKSCTFAMLSDTFSGEWQNALLNPLILAVTMELDMLLSYSSVSLHTDVVSLQC